MDGLQYYKSLFCLSFFIYLFKLPTIINIDILTINQNKVSSKLSDISVVKEETLIYFQGTWWQ